MKWRNLISVLTGSDALGDGNPEVTNIVYDSRKVGPGTVFVAIDGYKEKGISFLPDAVEKGACAFVSSSRPEPCPIPGIVVPDPRTALGLMARCLWDIDLSDITITGVTGTNGKTTVTHLVDHLMSHRYGRERTWMLGTIVQKLGAVTLDALRTTPESADTFRLLAEADPKPSALSMEVSSHSLALNRIAGLEFDIAIWTNLTQDHLDFHGSMEEYYQSKKKLFTTCMSKSSVLVINADDAWGRRLASELDRSVTTYGFAPNADFRIAEKECTWDKTRIEVVYRNERYTFESPLPGEFNIWNIAAACAAGLAHGLSYDFISESLKSMKPVGGRMERIAVSGGVNVVVDYAHTPDALAKVLETAGKLTDGTLICVFGCGGDRDRGKRPLMGEAVATHCDEAVVTSDNPRSEKPMSIIEDVSIGIPLDFPHHIIPDRREAIQKAFRIAHPGDCIVVAGKGHETYQEVNGIRTHFDDREVVRSIGGKPGKAVSSV